MKKTISLRVKFYFAAICFLNLLMPGRALARQDPLSAAKTLLLQRQYWQAIQSCSGAIKAYPQDREILSEAAYFTGVAYVHLFDFLTAKKNFAAVVEKYQGSKYYEDAYVGLGEVEFLQENSPEAFAVYQEFLGSGPSKKRLATVYFRLAELSLKAGDNPGYKKYLKVLETDFPLSFEAVDAARLSQADTGWMVQVGAFTNYSNAQKFIGELRLKGYDVYSLLCMLDGKKLCRVRVGRPKTAQEANDLKRRLEADGYFAKIFP